MGKKFVVYITYGVYVDTPESVDLENDFDYLHIQELAVAKMFAHGVDEVSTAAEVEIEEVSNEFEETI